MKYLKLYEEYNKIYSGKTVADEFVSWGEGHGDEEHTEYLSDRIKKYDFTKELVSIENLLEYDLDLSSFIDGEIEDEDVIIYEDSFEDCYDCPIIIAEWVEGHGKKAVIDGYHRIAQHIRNSDNDIEAYIYIK